MTRYKITKYVVDIDNIDGELYYRIINTKTKAVGSGRIKVRSNGRISIEGDYGHSWYRVVETAVKRFLNNTPYFDMKFNHSIMTPFGQIEYNITIVSDGQRIDDVRFDYRLKKEDE